MKLRDIFIRIAPPYLNISEYSFADTALSRCAGKVEFEYHSQTSWHIKKLRLVESDDEAAHLCKDVLNRDFAAPKWLVYTEALKGGFSQNEEALEQELFECDLDELCHLYRRWELQTYDTEQSVRELLMSILREGDTTCEARILYKGKNMRYQTGKLLPDGSLRLCEGLDFTVLDGESPAVKLRGRTAVALYKESGEYELAYLKEDSQQM